jgi:hypothetical protein
LPLVLQCPFPAACSLFEAVLYSVPLRHIETMVQQKKAGGRIFRSLRRDVDKPIAAILTLNTVANTGGAAIAGSVAAVVLGKEWLGYFSAALTLGILIFSEVIAQDHGRGLRKIPCPGGRLPGPMAGDPLETGHLDDRPSYRIGLAQQAARIHFPR